MASFFSIITHKGVNIMLQFVLYRFTTEAQSPYRRAFIMGVRGLTVSHVPHEPHYQKCLHSEKTILSTMTDNKCVRHLLKLLLAVS